MKPSMTVMKAKMWRLVEVVLIGVKGMNISQVSFSKSATKKNPTLLKTKRSSRCYQK